MKRFWRLTALLVLAVGLSACGSANEDAGTEVSVPETEALTEELAPETEMQTETESEDMLLDENSEPLYISEDALDPQLRDKLCRLLTAAAAHDKEAYLKEFDAEAFLIASESIKDDEQLAQKAEDERERQSAYFVELSEVFTGEFSGHLTDIRFVKWSENHILESEYYELDFSVETDSGHMLVSGEAYLHDGVWSPALRLWSFVDNAYSDYEELIGTQLLAAAQGDRDAFMACVDEELLVDVWLATYQYQETDSVSEEELSEVREEFREDVAYISGYAFEDLSEILGKDFDGEILEVQMFDKADYALPADVQLYGRILITVMNAENEFQEIEGGVYAVGDRKGVLLQPD